jgi:hypothetical protein
VHTCYVGKESYAGFPKNFVGTPFRLAGLGHFGSNSAWLMVFLNDPAVLALATVFARDNRG